MDEDLEKLAQSLKTFTPQMLEPPYSGLPTFFGAPLRDEIEDLDISLVGVPFDVGVTNRSGARHGPREIRNQSRLVGLYNHRSRMTPFAANRVADVGDVHFDTVYDLEEAISGIERFFANIASAGIVPVTAGGDHSITYPILKSLGQHKKEKIGLIHFDAHCDTSQPFHGSGFQHGCPMRNAVEAGVVDPSRSIQVGIRGTAELLWQFSYDCGMRVIHIEEFYELGWRKVLSLIRERVGDGPAYVSFDIDCLDPAFAPGTGTPVVGGMTSFEALQVLHGLKGLNVIGGDVVEVAPPFDPSGITALAGATMMFEILCLAAEAISVEAS
jgi:guanidinopropionase